MGSGLKAGIEARHGRAAVVLAGVAAALLLLALAAAPALAAPHEELGSFGPDGTSATEFKNNAGLAFAEAERHLWVADLQTDEVWGFDVSSPPPPFPPLAGFSPLTPPGSQMGEYGLLAADNTASPSAGRLYLAVEGAGSGGVPTLAAYGPAGTPPPGFPVSVRALHNQEAMAVDPRDGNIATLDRFSRTVRLFSPVGYRLDDLLTGLPGTPVALAFDTDGDLYVSTLTEIRKYSAASGYQQSIQVDDAGAGAIAVDSATHHLFAAFNEKVIEYGAEGEQIEEFATGIPAARFRGIAVDPANHYVYVSDAGAKGGERQTLRIKNASGGTYRLCFDPDEGGPEAPQCTGASGKGNLTGPAAGSGDVVRVSGRGNLTAGSKEVTQVNASGGEFAVGMAIQAPGVPSGTTITEADLEAHTIRLSNAATVDKAEAELAGGYIANLATTSGEFKVGMEVFGPGIPATGFNTIASVNGDGTLTLLEVPSASSAGASLTASSKTVTGVVTESGAFVEGEAIFGPGIPPGTTVACAGRSECPGNTLRMSAPATASASGASLSAALPYDMSAGGIASALQKLPAIGPGNVSVSGSGSTSPIERVVTFQGDFAGEDVPLLEADGSGLTGSSPEVEVQTTEPASVAGPGRVRVYSAGQTYPALKLGEPTALAETSVTLHGSVDPEGLTLDQCRFEYVTEAAFAATGFADLSSGGGSVGCVPGPPSGDTSYHDVSAALTGLTPGVRYRYRLLVDGPSVPPAAFPGGAFTTPSPPEVETVGSPVPEPTEAILSGRLNPHGLAGRYHFEYGTAGPCDANPCASTSDVPVRSDEVQRFAVSYSTDGAYRLAFEGAETPPLPPKAGAAEVQAALEALPTIGAGNVVVAGDASQTRSTFVVTFAGALAGRDLPPLTKTGESASGEEIAATLVQGGPPGEIVFVAARVQGLAPDTTYHYRLVGEAGGATAAGADMTLRTRPTAPPPDPGFPHPPGSERAYELVSLPDSGGNPTEFALGFSADGDHALYQVSGGTPISQQGTFFNQLLADRVETAPHVGGWRSRLLAPASAYDPEAPDWFFSPAADFSRFVAENSNGVGEAPVIHLWRIAPGGPYEPLVDVDRNHASRFFEFSADTSRVIAAIKDSLDPANPVSAKHFHLYDVSDPAQPRLLNVLPGAAAGCGVEAAPYQGDATPIAFQMRKDADRRGWLSADGSRAYFVSEEGCAASPLQLYEREIEAGATKLISGPVVSGPTCAAYFLRATDQAVFFLTASRLVAQDSAVSSCSSGGFGGEPSGDVYRYDLGTGQLRCLSCVVPGRDVDIEIPSPGTKNALLIVGVAADGSAAYFESPHALLSGAAPQGIYRLDVRCELGESACPGGPLAYVAPAGGGGRSTGAAMGGDSVVSADGRVLVFKSADPRLNAQGGARNDGFAQYYRYDQADRSLTCISCPPDGSGLRVPVQGVSVDKGTYTDENTYNGSMASADGSVVAFSSPSPLVPADQNTPGGGQNPYSGSDVYEWRGDHAVLVTDGLTQWNPDGDDARGSPSPAALSPSGRDLFFFANARLTPEAIDDYKRLYDARLGGGFTPPAEPPPCPLEVCQGTPRGAPEEQQPGSRELRGAGNPTAPAHRRCRKRTVRRHGRCVRRRHRRRHRHQQANGSHGRAR